MKIKIILNIFVLLAIISEVTGQSDFTMSKAELSGQLNPVSTAVPFLTISPDSRSGAMGDLGAATSADIYSIYWNPAKYSFIESSYGASFSYTPWLRNLVNDIDLGYLTGYYRFAKKNVVAASFRYFSLGDITFTNTNGEFQKIVKPNEFAADISYSRLLGPKLSGALAFRYIRSDLAQGAEVQGVASEAGVSGAVDISTFYTDKVKIADFNGTMALGLNISNIGNKLSYNSDQEKDFLPTNLRLGGSLLIDIDEYNSIMGSVDFNKLLIPTKPLIIVNDLGDTIIYGNSKTNVSVIPGMLQSFSDAPGGFKEEMYEIAYSIGAEYWYRKQFAIRGGYFHESETKGNRKYFTMGLGLKLNVFGLDFSYLVSNNNNPLANTLRFSLTWNFTDTQRKSGKNMETNETIFQ